MVVDTSVRPAILAAYRKFSIIIRSLVDELRP
jgi:hypothetical protein